MKIGFASLVGVEPTPFPDLVRWAGANGLHAIEVNIGPGYGPIGGASFPGSLDIPAILRDGPGATQELLAANNVEIASLAPMMNLLSADLAKREMRIAYMRQTIDAAVALGVDTVVTFTGSAFGMHFYGTPGVGDAHSSNRTRDNLRIFKEVYTRSLPMPKSGGSGSRSKRPAGADRRATWRTARSCGTRCSRPCRLPRSGLSFDPSHLVWLHIPHVPDVIRAYGSRIYHFDGKDCEILYARLARQGILGSGWWRYRLPGLGALDWRAIFSALRDIGYDGVIAIENEDPLCPGKAGVKWAADYLNGLLLPPSGGSDPPI